jgi:hypothetical protein
MALPPTMSRRCALINKHHAALGPGLPFLQAAFLASLTCLVVLLVIVAALGVLGAGLLVGAKGRGESPPTELSWHAEKPGFLCLFSTRRPRASASATPTGYLLEKRSISDCLGYGSESVGSGLAGCMAAAAALGVGGAP